MSTKSPELFLSPDQRALLLAALNSNAPANSQPRSTAMNKAQSNDSMDDSNLADDSFDASFFTDADALGDVDYSLDLNYNFGLENPEKNGADHEKRKLSIDDDDDDEADPHETEPKRREGDDKTAKKPGRKPITNEPTSKRKAQNRAAQRAFRERKEKHLKDLELKVNELEKESESTNQENKALKDQVDKLQTELKEYRKRFSLGGGVVNRSPSNSISNNLSSLENSLGSTGGFNFDFPLFGSFAQPGQNVVGPKSSLTESPNRGSNFPAANYRVSPVGVLEINRSNRNSLGSVSPHGSNNNSPATRSNSNVIMNGSTQQSPLQVHRVSLDEPRFPSNDILSDLFSPSILNAVNNDPKADYMNMGNTSFSSQQSTPHMSLFNFSDSPSASSVSQQSMKAGQNNSSSCGTTPEATDMASPPSQSKIEASKLNSITEEGEHKAQKNRQRQRSSVGDVSSFCDMLGKACGTSSNPLPLAGRNLSTDENINGADASFSWLAAQNGGTFEPALFNDYRDSGEQFTTNTNTAGMSYFDDAFPSAFDLNLPPSPPASSVDKDKTKTTAPGLTEEDDDEEVVPGEDLNSLLKCNQIWDKVQSHPKFASGEIDMDNLCSELRSKAKCSESGVVMDKKDVEAILNKPVPSLWGL